MPPLRLSRHWRIRGQALVSHVTAAAVADSAPPGLSLLKLDSYVLPSSTQAFAVYQVSSAGSPVVFPPLQAHRHRPHNLPAAMTTYLPRPRLQARLGALLAPSASNRTRLLTLTGVGGGGKTRLALQLARDLLPHFPEGAWVVELASLTEPRDVPAQIGRALGLREERTRPFMETISSYLRSREQPILLVLDNCEHLLSACAQASASLLQAGEEVYLLATSRERLDMQGERAEEVPLLSTPSVTAVPSNSPRSGALSQSGSSVRARPRLFQALSFPPPMPERLRGSAPGLTVFPWPSSLPPRSLPAGR